MSRKAKKMIGMVYGALEVLNETDDSVPRNKRFVVKCIECGRICEMWGGNIRRHAGWFKKWCHICHNNQKIHGLWDHECYGVWNGMLWRCYNEKHIHYKNYGGRGINVCSKWREGPTAFIAWLVKNGWKRGLQIDRINNDLGYSPENCRVTTPMVNCNNSRTNRRITIYGENLTVSEAARKYNLNMTTVRERLNRGWTGDRVVMAVN